MSTYQEVCFQKWGKRCLGCGVGLGIEVHHIDSDHNNDDPNNLMPLCGTCHNLVTVGTLQVDPKTREITPNLLGLFEVGPSVNHPPHQVQVQLLKFKRLVKPWESENKAAFLLLQDGKNGAYYTECHVPAQTLASLLFEDSVLNPDDLDDPDAEEYKLNREIIEFSDVYRKMQEDAEEGRPFSDVIAEFNDTYEIDKPLKILAGQHRSHAICNAVQSNKEIERLHGIKTYFFLSKDQRAEISLISNTSIAISKQLIDRLGEHHLGSESRKWCQQVGLLDSTQDFADRLSGEDRLSVQIVRALVVNFVRGQKFSGDIDSKLHDGVYLPKTGSLKPDPEYGNIIREYPSLWSNTSFLEMGRSFAVLSKKQEEACSSAPDKFKDLRKVAFKYKTFTPTVAAAWAYVSGVLQRDQKRLRNHYLLPNKYDEKRSPDPLNAKQMSVTRHENADEPTYRGLGTRQSSKDTQRLVELFILQSHPDYAGTITMELLRTAVHNHVKKVNEREQEELARLAREAAKQIQKGQK